MSREPEFTEEPPSIPRHTTNGGGYVCPSEIGKATAWTAAQLYWHHGVEPRVEVRYTGTVGVLHADQKCTMGELGKALVETRGYACTSKLTLWPSSWGIE
jgi:hypothetical protein